MTTMTTARPPLNHAGHDGCDGSRPLTLTDRERLHGRTFRVWEWDGRHASCYCARCLADLPPGFAAMSHVCDDEQPRPRLGDLVRYHGSLTEFHGGTWEVTVVHPNGRLRLFGFPDRALDRVHPASVTVAGHATAG
jgi:hypothetical protein